MKALFTTRLFTPQGFLCQFKVYSQGASLWEFENENLGLSILLYVHSCRYAGMLLSNIGNEVQQNNLICQAIFALEEFYR